MGKNGMLFQHQFISPSSRSKFWSTAEPEKLPYYNLILAGEIEDFFFSGLKKVHSTFE